MTDTATLAIEITTNGADKANQSMDALSHSAEKVERKGIKASVAIEQLKKEQEQAAAQSTKFNDALKKQGQSLNELTTATERQGQALENMSRQSSMIGTVFKTLLSGYTLLKGIDFADTYTQMASRIKIAVGAGEEYNEVQKRLSENAKTTYRSLSEATEGFLTFNGSMKSIGYNTRQVLDFTDSLTYAFTANATKGYKAQAAMSAIDRAMVRGVIDGRAWQTLMSAVPNSAEMIAKHFKVSEKEVRALGVSGKITSKALIDAFSAFKGDNRQAVEKMPVSFKDGLQTLSNSVMEFLGKANETYDITGKIASGFKWAADNVGVLAGAFAGLGAFKLGGMLSQVGTLTTNFTALGGALANVSKALLLNPFGLALTAIVALITATGEWKNVIDFIAPVLGQIGEFAGAVFKGVVGTIEQMAINTKQYFSDLKKELQDTDSVYQGLFNSEHNGFFGVAENLAHIADLAAYSIKAVGVAIHETVKGVGQTVINGLSNVWLAIKKGMGNLINLLNKAFEKLNKGKNALIKGANKLLPERLEIAETQKIEIANPFDDDLKQEFKGIFDGAFEYQKRFTELQDRQFSSGLNALTTEYAQSIIDGRKVREDENKALFSSTEQLGDISGSLSDITNSLSQTKNKMKSDTEKYFDSMKSETQKYIEKLPEINKLKDAGDYNKAWEIEASIDMSKIDWRIFEKMSQPEQLKVDYSELQKLIEQELTGQTDANAAMQNNTDALTANTQALQQIATMQNAISKPENQSGLTPITTPQQASAGEQVIVGLRLEKDNEKVAGQVVTTRTMADALQRFFAEKIDMLAMQNA